MYEHFMLYVYMTSSIPCTRIVSTLCSAKFESKKIPIYQMRVLLKDFTL